MVTPKKLREVRGVRDIPAPAYSTCRCDHCPLHTAVRATGRIAGAATLVLGVAECVFYVLDAATALGEQRDPLTGMVMDWHDVTFGACGKLEAAVDELMEESAPSAVFLVTTCVPEITGDDVDALAETLGARYGIPVLTAHTEHFKTWDAFAGIGAVLSACADAMKPAAPGQAVNILGQGRQEFARSELAGFLAEAGVEVGTTIPDCTVEDLKRAPSARLNIVVNRAALALARAMEKRFGVPFVQVGGHIFPDRVLAGYEDLFAQLDIPLPDAVHAAYQAVRQTVAASGKTLAGKRYISVQTEFPTYELNAFLCTLGMRPLLIESHTFPGRDDGDVQAILEQADPAVVQFLCPEDARALGRTLQADLNLDWGLVGGRGLTYFGFQAIAEHLQFLAGYNGEGRSGR
ncbi:MAG: nitrogenase component 1 [Oscillospiraceae bacterium]|nr:nitrogenase component 1 [Oscillospiraceae bacterium]